MTAKKQKKYLFIISSSYGHIFPAIRLGNMLQARNHEVLFVTDRQYQLLFDMNGIQALYLEAGNNPFLATSDWYNSDVASEHCRRISPIIDIWHPDAIVCSQLAISAYVLAEWFHLPLTVMGYTEYMFPAIGEVQSTKQWRIESLTGHYNNLRLSLGMTPVAPCPESTPLLGDRYLLRSVPEFTEPENWPDKIEYVGGLLWSPDGYNTPLLNFVAQNKNQKRPLILMQIGRLFEERDRWPTLINLLSKLRADFVVDLSRADYLTSHQTFPDNIFAHAFIDIASIKEDLSCIICTGQSTTILSALCYAKPVLAIPNSADGNELSQRIVRHRLGGVIQNSDQLTMENIQIFIDAVQSGEFEQQSRTFQSYFQGYEEQQSLYKRCFG